MSDALGDNGNGKVTMAILATKLDAISDKLDCMADHGERITRLETRTDMLAGANAFLALIGSAIAAWIGGKS